MTKKKKEKITNTVLEILTKINISADPFEREDKEDNIQLNFSTIQSDLISQDTLKSKDRLWWGLYIHVKV